MLRFATLLAFGTLIEVLATVCFHFTQTNRLHLAAATNTLLVGGALFCWVEVSRRPAVAIPYLAGIWLGGFLGMKIKIKLEDR